jgi:hypothetical protein
MASAPYFIHFDVGIHKEQRMQFSNSRPSAIAFHLYQSHGPGTPFWAMIHYPSGKHPSIWKEKFGQLRCRGHRVQIGDTYLHTESLSNGGWVR